MNCYERTSLIKQLNNREKINLIHECFEKLYESRQEYFDNTEIARYLEKLKEADEIFEENNEFYT